LAVAVIAAAIADPLVEWASNAGLFGDGNFTDHSNLDILPALLIGGFFVLTHLLLRVRRALAFSPERDLLRASNDALRTGVARLLPLTFALQLLALYSMETSEQLAVAGHALGGTVWLGGPLLFSLAAHAVACVLVAYALSAALLACARTTVRAIRLIRAMAVRPAHGPSPIELPLPEACRTHLSAFVLCSVGERAPPLPAV
jgi:hypothetical protein